LCSFDLSQQSENFGGFSGLVIATSKYAKYDLMRSVLQITALDGRRMWSLHDEEVLIGFVSVVSAALENLQNASETLASNL
jgi:hypothetical protein